MREEDIKALSTLPSSLVKEAMTGAVVDPEATVLALLAVLAEVKAEYDAMREQPVGAERYGITPAGRLASADKTCIKVWVFHDAPADLRALSEHGGDEDWLALLPPGVDPPFWMESGTEFGCCSVSTHELPDGWTVCIGAHA